MHEPPAAWRAAFYGIFSVRQSYTISRAFSAYGPRLYGLYSQRPIFASKEAIADSLGHGDQSKNSETVGVLDRRMAMAQVIQFYIPDRFRKKVRWVPSEQRGKVIEFPAEVKKSA
jgi:hypothetical protein